MALLRWNAALKGGQELVPGGVTSRRYQVWAVRSASASARDPDERLLLVGVDPGPALPVDSTRVEDAIYALADLDSLDAYFDEGIPARPEVDVLSRFLTATGDPGQPPYAAAAHEPGKVDFEALLTALYLLRRMWLISAAIQAANFEHAKKLFIACQANIRLVDDKSLPPAGDHAAWLRSLRFWAALLVGRFCSVTEVVPDAKTGRYAIIASVSTPLELVAITLGVSLGAVDAGIPGVYICEYTPCGRTFVGNRSDAKGAHYFCSPRCGKRFHSTKNTYAKRAAKRAEKQQASEE